MLLLALILIYFRIADHYNIIDKPNHRSAHTVVTLRGGGVVYPLAFLLFVGSLLFSAPKILPFKSYLLFGAGLLIICVISFIDDILDLSSKLRLVFHFIAVTLLMWFIGVFTQLPIWAVPIIYVMIIGILNAYNFMDGINGMTGLYSLVILGSLLYVNYNIVEFVDERFIIFPVLASVVFLFFNFRKKAKCFMGDVGSMGIAFWVLALLGLLMIKTGQLKWILFLTVYGTEVVLTIIERLRLKENIFEAHRRHLYQLFANEKKNSHLVVSAVYALVQLVINIIIIKLDVSEWLVFAALVIPAVLIYLIIKLSVKKQLALTKSPV